MLMLAYCTEGAKHARKDQCRRQRQTWHCMRMCAQGDIESVAGMSPKALTEMLEKVSGSGAFRKDYEALEVAKEAADEKVAFLSARKKVTHAEKRQKKEQKEEAEKHLSLQRELVRLPLVTPSLIMPVWRISCDALAPIVAARL